MSKNNRFRINGLSRDPGSMNFGTLLKRHPNDWDVSRKVFIGGLRGDGGTKDRFDIEFQFHEVGKVTDVWISQKYGFAYVEMEDQKTALKAVKELNGTFMCGGNVTVEMAKRDDEKRKERELDINMRWSDSKKRDKVRDRGRSRSRSEERPPGLEELERGTRSGTKSETGAEVGAGVKKGEAGEGNESGTEAIRREEAGIGKKKVKEKS